MDTAMFSPTSDQFDLSDWLMFEAHARPDQEFDDVFSATPWIRSSSDDGEASEPSTRRTQSLSGTATSMPPLKLTWLKEGQTKANSRPQRRLAPQSERPALSITSSESSPNSSSTDSHSEASCSKCRMTEMEARKCRVERRREQNRASQRKFRARKEAKIRDAVQQVSTLEVYIDFLEKQNDDLEATNARIFQQLEDLRRSKAVSVDASTSPLFH